MILCQFLPQINMSQPQIHTCALPLEPPIHLPPHPTLLGCHRALCLNSLHNTANCHCLFILYMVKYMFQCYSPNFSHSLLPQLCAHVSVIYVYISIAIILIDYPSRFHIYALIYDICFSLSDLPHSVNSLAMNIVVHLYFLLHMSIMVS